MKTVKFVQQTWTNGSNSEKPHRSIRNEVRDSKWSTTNTTTIRYIYSALGGGYPCFHDVAVLSETFGSLNLHKYVTTRYMSSTWINQYEYVTFPLPFQAYIRCKIVEAGRLIILGNIYNNQLRFLLHVVFQSKTLIKDRFHGMRKVLHKVSVSTIFLYTTVEVMPQELVS